MGIEFLAMSSFPKRCATCSRVYETPEDFIANTGAIMGRSGLKQSWDDDNNTLIELYRNCNCGSTLMEFCRNRRDLSEAGTKRREKFDRLMAMLVNAGMDKGTARSELLRAMKGEVSDLIKGLSELNLQIE